MKRKKSVLFFIPPNCGGAERVTLTIAQLLDPSHFNIHIVIIGREKGDIVQFIPDSFPTHLIKTWNIWDFTTLKIYFFLRKLRPYAVFCSLTYLNPRVILAAKMMKGIKVIVRNNISYMSRRKNERFLIKHIYPKADAIILQTEEMRQEMMQIDHIDTSKLFVCFNPLDTKRINESVMDAINPFDEIMVNFVYVGSIKYSKGIDCLISAFEIVCHTIPNSKLYIVGKINLDVYYSEIMTMIRKAGIMEKVVWTGFQANPYIYIKHANCFVLPSRLEGLPNVLLEAMYLKTPVVATRSVPVIDRIVTPERGFVVDVEDVNNLANKMLIVSAMKIEKDYVQPSDKIVELFE